jgi:hypothetical protein
MKIIFEEPILFVAFVETDWRFGLTKVSRKIVLYSKCWPDMTSD